MSDACHQCKFWNKSLSAKYGECRRHAPTPTQRNEGRSVWPQTEDFDWCGDYVNRYAAPDPTIDSLLMRQRSADGTVAADKPTM